MKKEGLSDLFLGFAVSEISSEKTGTEDGAPYSIYDKEWPRDAMVVVAVFSDTYRKEMSVKAKEAGFTNILPVDAYLLRVLEEYYA